MLGDHDTIAAVATPKGNGALAVVRLSGPSAPEIFRKCFISASYDPTQSHRAFYGCIRNPETGDEVDEVLALNFIEGRGFTGEPATEILCHGGAQVTELVLSALLAGGARLARPGEFTYRSVMNGKMDLARAESVLELIHARTPRAAALALRNIRGAFSEKIIKLEDEVTFILANLEAAIDFTTEDIQPVDYSEMRKLMADAAATVDQLLSTYVSGKAVSQGLRVVLAGKPNSGKSSVLNALVGKSRSIVTPQPGTTRDTIEEDLVIEGHLFRLVDTAGLRQTDDAVESEGVARANEEIDSADLILYVVDGITGLDNEDAQKILSLETPRVLLCLNKEDLGARGATLRQFGLDGVKNLKCSAVTGKGLDGVREFLAAKVRVLADSETASIVTTPRQREALLVVGERLRKAAKLTAEKASPEFIVFELQDSLRKIQEILGKNAGDDVMNRVFKEFCIGK